MKTSSRIVVSVLLIVFAGLFCILLSNLLDNIGHYCRVCENPLRVTAKVTKHRESEDSEGDTTYVSYITYTVDSKEYKDIKYESTSSKSRLTPIGETVAVDVSPEDPSWLLSSLKGSWIGAVVVSLFISLLLTWAITSLLYLPLSDENLGIPDTETIKRDLKIKNCTSSSLIFTIIFIAILHFIIVPYTEYVPMWIFVVTAIACGFLIRALIIFLRNNSYINNENFSIRRNTLVSKERYEDQDSVTYYLHYKSDTEESWKNRVSKKYFNRVHEGTTVTSVTLNGAKKPLIHYDIDGNAQ